MLLGNRGWQALFSAGQQFKKTQLLKDYFLLQHSMLNRRLLEMGIPLWASYVAIGLGFLAVTGILFAKTALAGYLYVLLALSLVSRLGGSERNDFLRATFSRRRYWQLRASENLICALPFLPALLHHGCYLLALAFPLAAAALALLRFRAVGSFVLPTPFGRQPFEFAAGFRQNFLLVGAAYFLAFMAVGVGNFNLGAFSQLLVGFVCMSFYAKPENEYYVWAFRATPRQFLYRKLKTCGLHFTAISVPILIPLLAGFPEQTTVLLGIYLLTLLYLAAALLAKYSAYPAAQSLPQGVLLGLAFFFPPALLGIIPFLYAKSIEKLNPFLNGTH